MSVVCALFSPLFLLSCAPPRFGRVTVGAKNFTEQVVLGELLAQEIEAVGGKPVNRRFYLAGSYLCHQALIGGRIDAYVEYTGTALTAILKQPLDRNAARVDATVSRLYAQRFHIRVEPGLGFEDTFAIITRGPEADQHHWQSIADLKPDAANLRLGVGYEFQSRPDGLSGLEAAYGLRFSSRPRVMDLGLLYRSLGAGQVDVVAGNSTDGPVRALGFRILTDNLHYFPPYEAVPLIREDTLHEHPEVQAAADRLAGKVSAEEMRTMNDAVDGQHRDVAEVVRAFRQQKGL